MSCLSLSPLEVDFRNLMSLDEVRLIDPSRMLELSDTFEEFIHGQQENMRHRPTFTSFTRTVYMTESAMAFNMRRSNKYLSTSAYSHMLAFTSWGWYWTLMRRAIWNKHNGTHVMIKLPRLRSVVMRAFLVLRKLPLFWKVFPGLL